MLSFYHPDRFLSIFFLILGLLAFPQRHYQLFNTLRSTTFFRILYSLVLRLANSIPIRFKDHSLKIMDTVSEYGLHFILKLWISMKMRRDINLHLFDTSSLISNHFLVFFLLVSVFCHLVIMSFLKYFSPIFHSRI